MLSLFDLINLMKSPQLGIQGTTATEVIAAAEQFLGLQRGGHLGGEALAAQVVRFARRGVAQRGQEDEVALCKRGKRASSKRASKQSKAAAAVRSSSSSSSSSNEQASEHSEAGTQQEVCGGEERRINGYTSCCILRASL